MAAEINKKITASWVMDIHNTSTQETLSIHRCDECGALVLSSDANDHLKWHFTIMHAPQ